MQPGPRGKPRAPSQSPPGGAAPPYVHEPVLVEQVLSLVPPGARLGADVTLGGGGHAAALLARFPALELFGCDQDAAAVAAAGEHLAPFAGRVLLKQARFSELPRHVLVESLDFLLLDLGVSSPQLDAGARGFSFSADGPLDMRMDPDHTHRTAAHLVNQADPAELRDLIRQYGEERHAGRIARAIVSAREEGPITTTGHLARLVAQAVPGGGRRRGLHPATRTFQALRMAVNDEPGELARLLDVALGLLRAGGRIAVISFHSLEDRPVKERFRSWESPCACPATLPLCICGKAALGRRVTTKPLRADAAEIARNPRSRSARLRAFEK